MNLSKGLYLVEVKQGQVTTYDGPYFSESEVAQSFNHFLGLKWVRADRSYFLAEVITDTCDELKSTKELFSLLIEKNQLKLKEIPPFQSQGVFHWDEKKQDFVRNK